MQKLLACLFGVSVIGIAIGCERRIESEPSAPISVREPIRDAAILLAMSIALDAKQLVGTRVELGSAHVQHVGRAAVRVGPSLGSSVLVVPVDPRMVSGLERGDIARVRGVVKEMPPGRWATQQAGREPLIEAALTDGMPLYIEAEQLQAPPEPAA